MDTKLDELQRAVADLDVRLTEVEALMQQTLAALTAAAGALIGPSA